MSRSTPRRNQNLSLNHQSPLQDPNSTPLDHNHHNNNNHGPSNPTHSYSSYSHSHSHSLSHSHGHGPGHGRTRSRQVQEEARHQHQQHHPHHQQQQQQQHQQHQSHIPTSDYESDTPQYMASHPSMQPAAALAARTNTELNLSVLQRYLPSITTVLSIAANAVVYTFQHPSEWKRTNLEGTMFICSQRKAPGAAGETGCLFILNRKGLQNFILDLDTVSDFELAGDLLIFKLDYAAHEMHLESGEAVRPLVLGLWTYAEDKTDREMNAALITDMWSQALRTREARAQAAASGSATFAALPDAGPAAQATGRKLSVSDLFSAYNGNSLPAQAP
ncbi:PH domain-like protein [Nemania sp. FL0031]|nr:PH domain-like protein [Nemania sp. FL0031]